MDQSKREWLIMDLERAVSSGGLRANQDAVIVFVCSDEPRDAS
jgi:hypothetical protein